MRGTKGGADCRGDGGTGGDGCASKPGGGAGVAKQIAKASKEGVAGGIDGGGGCECKGENFGAVSGSLLL